MLYRIKLDYSKLSHHHKPDAIFGPHNEGLVIDAPSARAAWAKMNDGLLPGRRLNWFYLIVEEA